MGKAGMIGSDLAKHVGQRHGSAADGPVLFRRQLRREKLLDFLATQPACVVALEACASACYRGRAIVRLGHEVRLIATSLRRAVLERQKNDTADAPCGAAPDYPRGTPRRAICEAAGRPTMRCVGRVT